MLLSTITLFSIFKYIASLKQNSDLSRELNRIQQEFSALSHEKQNLLQDLEKEKEKQQKLSQDNSELKDYLRASKERLTRLFREAKETQDSIEDLNTQVSLAKAESKALLEETEKIKSNLAQVTQENASYQAKFSSIDELKKAIRELKMQRRKMSLEIIKIRTEQIIEGNRGYLMKAGRFTYPSKVKIEVNPAQNK